MAVLIVTLSGCGVLATKSSGRDVQLPLPSCPPVEVILDHGWLGPQTKSQPDGTARILFAMTLEDRAVFLRWNEAWRRCAIERGIVIEEANR